MSNITVQSADQALSGLLQWGIGGAILAVFVAPTFLLLVRSAQKREDARQARDDVEASARREREMKLVDALAKSVEQQRIALEQWRAFESAEEKTHAAILAGLSSIADRLNQQAANTAESHVRIAQILDSIASKLTKP